MEELLTRLLVPDTNVVEKATEELRQVLKKAESTEQLFQLMISSEKPMIRQYAATILKERYSKGKNWAKLPPEVRTRAKELMTHSLINEGQSNVRNSVAQLIGAIMKHEISNNGWPQIFQLIQELATSPDAAKKELGLYTLVKITEIATECYTVHTESIMNLLGQVMQSTTDSGSTVAFYILKTLLNFASFVEGNQMMVNAYHEMMIPAMNIVQALSLKDEARAIEAMELFDELCEEAVTVIGPRVRDLVAMSLSIATNNEYGDELRSRGLSLLNILIKTKKKAIVKHKMVQPIVDVLWELMLAKSSDEEQDFFADENEEQAPSVRATHTMHLLGLHFQPNKIVPLLVQRIYPAIEGNDVYAKKAAYLTIAGLAEGCPEYVRSNCLVDFVQLVSMGMSSDSPIVRNAAFYATANLSEYLQPEISEYAEQFIPMLFRYLDQVYKSQDQSNTELPSGVQELFDAIETYCETLEEGLLPYLPNIMQQLLSYLNNGTWIKLRRLVFSAIGAVANATKQHMLPYFQDIMKHLEIHLNEQQTEDTMPLQIVAVDTLGVLIRSIGGENLKHVVEGSLTFGLNLLVNTSDPDVKTAIYGLFASISTVMKKDMAPVLPKIAEYMLESVRSTDGVVARYKDDDTCPFLPVYDEGTDSDEENIEITDSEDDNDDGFIAEYRVNTSYVDEKEEAIRAFTLIAENTEEVFLPYIEKCFEEVYRMTNHPHTDVKVASIDALLQFCVNLSKIEGKEALQKALSMFVPKLSELVRLDTESPVVLEALAAYTGLLKEIKADVLLDEGHRDAIISCIFDIVMGKTECQDQDDTPENESENESEEDEQLFEYAGEAFTELGKLIPPDDFVILCKKMLPKLEERCKPMKTEAQRSFATGTIAECIVALRKASSFFAPRLYALFCKSIQDKSPEVRNNVFYGLGELILQSKETMFCEYNNVLSLLEAALAREDHPGPRDNIVAVFAKMIMVNYTAVEPIQARFALIFEHLPLQQDYEEYLAVFNAILTLYEAGHFIIKDYLPKILSLAINVLYENKAPNDETKESAVKIIKAINKDFIDIYNTVTGSLPAEVMETLMRI